MGTPEDTNQAPDDGAAAGGWRARWKKHGTWVAGFLAGVLATVTASLLTAALIVAVHRVHNTVSPKQYLSAIVTIPTPAASCEGGQSWVFDKVPPQLPLPPRKTGDLDGWAAANGGIPASGNYIAVTLQGLNGRNVLVHDISVNVVSRTEPPHGTYAILSRGCEGFAPYQFSFNLDTSPIAVTAEPDRGYSPELVARPVELPHLITGSGPEFWHLAAVTQTCTCEWTATLNWTADDGKKGTTKINDHGHPFRVAALTRATPEFADHSSGRWVPTS
jgi:hypothetical protein